MLRFMGLQRGTGIEHHKTADIDFEVAQRPLELEASAGNIFGKADFHYGIAFECLFRVGAELAVDVDVAATDQGACLVLRHLGVLEADKLDCVELRHRSSLCSRPCRYRDRI